jgi:hypothetical protein
LPSRISKTLEEYAVLEVVPKVQGYSCTYMRSLYHLVQWEKTDSHAEKIPSGHLLAGYENRREQTTVIL